MSTQHRDHLELQTKLNRVQLKSKQDSKCVFNNLGHILDKDLLRLSFHSLDGRKAVGIDGISKEEYEKNLELNLGSLLVRIRKGEYYPMPARLVEIPKSNGETRPIAVACTEDKVVQEAVKRILESIYEPLFGSSSHGGRPGRGCDTALVALNLDLMRDGCGAVLEIDLRKFFNSIPHRHLFEMLQSKIQDQRFIRLIIRLIRNPVLNKTGTPESTEVGVPQGSILSPLISNVFLNEVLDKWFDKINLEVLEGKATLVRYLDDCVFTFRTLARAIKFRSLLQARLKSFGIELNEDKTRTLPAGRGQAELHRRRGKGIPGFTFLGFLHVWGTSRSRRTGKTFNRVKRRTDPERFQKKIREVKQYIRRNRHARNLIPKVKQVVIGYLNYFSVNDNEIRCSQFLEITKRYLLKHLNRRSQKKSLTWERYLTILEKEDFPDHIRVRNLFFNWRPAQQG